jgi:biotin-[acetyl-CoA-carboxylase] ligase BirA-like protein
MQAFHFDVVDSTNEVAKRLISEGRLGGRGYVLAREQTAGKGQRGRVWASPRAAGIYLSVVDRPGVVADLSLFTRAAAVASAAVLRDETAIDVRIKPINDLCIAHRKLGGILTEAVIERQELRALVTGIGVNTHQADRVVGGAQLAPISLQEAMPPAQFAYMHSDELVRKLVGSVLTWNYRVARGELPLLEAEWERLSDLRRSADICGAPA